MATERLYQKDVYLKEADVKVTAVRTDGGKLRVATDRTVFFPEGGGQPCDLGTLGGLRVLDVQEDKADGLVWHTLEIGAGPEEHAAVQPGEAIRDREADETGQEPKAIRPGETAHAVVDWKRRFSNMQMHCGEHILSGRFHALYGAENRGFHMGADYMTVDILSPDGSTLSEEQIRAAEEAANEIVWSNAPVTTLRFESLREAAAMPLRKDIKADEDISVVLIGDPEDPYDCCACCGTHPERTGQIGLISVLKAESYKGMTRLTIKAGRPAFEESVLRSKIASEMAQKYSCEVSAIAERKAADDAKNALVRRELSELRSALSKEAELELRKALPKQGGSLAVFSYSLQSADDLQSMARRMEDAFERTTALYSERDKTVILASPGTPDAGRLVREYAGMYGGKGGGGPKLARAIFAEKSDADIFLDLLEKHLR